MGGKANTKEIANAPEILLVDKPRGITSFDVVYRVRRWLGAKKVGHAGTLDPRATGLLVLGIGVGTKKLHEFLKLPKIYEAEVLLGKRTDTGDLDGTIIEESAIPGITKEYIENVLRKLEGEIKLPVPIYSAIKRKGKPLYEYARSGKAIDVPIKTMLVAKAELLNISGDTLSVRFSVGSGTYIRSLAEELGRRLGTVATLAELRRISIGGFDIKDARQLSDMLE